MTKLAQLKKDSASLEKILHQFGDLFDPTDAQALRRQLEQNERQQSYREHYKEEIGTVGRYSVAESLASKEVRERRKQSAVIVGDVVQMPYMAEGQVGFPNVLLRSSLFGIWSASKFEQSSGVGDISCETGHSIRLTGMAVWQKDYVLMAMLLKLAGDNLRASVSISFRQLLKLLGQHDGKSNYLALSDSLTRLEGATLSVTGERGTTLFEGPMIQYRIDENAAGRTVKFEVNVQWAQLFGTARWTKLPVAELQALKRKELAIWLASYLATHNGSLPIKLGKLYELSGVRTETRYFRRSVKEALAECVEVGLLLEGVLTKDDMVSFQPARRRGK